MTSEDLTLRGPDTRPSSVRLAGGRDLVTSLWRFCRKRPLAGTGLALVLVLCASALFANVIAPYGYNDSVGTSFEAPSLSHPLGTDRLGRDQLSRIVYGGRISIFIGVSSILVGSAIALAIGLISGTFGGLTDLIIQRFVDACMAFPALVFLLAVVSAFGSSIRNVILVLGLLLGVGSSRVIRSAVFVVVDSDFVGAARAGGCTTFRLMWRHVLPNIMPTVIVLMSVNIGFAILAEAGLSFLGLGVQPPQPSWGNLLSTDIQYMVLNPGLVIWPGVALTLAVFGFNALGDGLRDALDPRLRGN